MSKMFGGGVVAGILVIAAGYAFGPPLSECKIKGNVSPTLGEKIYHLPGQEHYTKSRISLIRGERWFCSEQAAQDHGWRKAYK